MLSDLSSYIDEPEFDVYLYELYNDSFNAWGKFLDDDQIFPSKQTSYNASEGAQPSYHEPPRPYQRYRYTCDSSFDEVLKFNRYRRVIDFLISSVFCGASKSIVNGGSLSRLGSGRLALVPADAQVGDLVFNLPKIAIRFAAYKFNTPCFLVRSLQAGHSPQPPPTKGSFISTMDEDFKFSWGTGFIDNSALGRDDSDLDDEEAARLNIARTFGLTSKRDEDPLHQARLVGECLTDGTAYTPLFPPTDIHNPHVDEHQRTVIVIR